MGEVFLDKFEVFCESHESCIECKYEKCKKIAECREQFTKDTSIKWEEVPAEQIEKWNAKELLNILNDALSHDFEYKITNGKLYYREH